MKVLFFADGSTPLGAGHQVRTGVLARALQARGHAVEMVCRALPGSSESWAWHGLPIERTPGELDADAAFESAWRGREADVVVVDHYSVSRVAFGKAAASARLVVFDDVPGDRFPPGALVVNPAPALQPRDYPDQVLALGPAHAVIREEFCEARASAEARSGVLVMPGSGAAPWLGPVVDGLLARADRRVTVVTGAYRTSAHDELAARHERHPDRLTWRSGLTAAELAAAMRTASVGLLSASTVVFEAAAVGLPFVAVVTADNQRYVAEGLRRYRVPVFDDAPAKAMLASLEAAPASELRVDGRGASRVAGRLEELVLPGDPVHLRPFTWTDSVRLLDWVNDPGTRQGSFSDRRIEPGEHEAWVSGKMMDPDVRLWVVEDGGRAIGTLRLDRRGAAAVVSILVVPERRGRGDGTRMLAALDDWARRSRFARKLVAYIREDNMVSQRLFAHAGYAAAGTAVRNRLPARVVERYPSGP